MFRKGIVSCFVVFGFLMAEAQAWNPQVVRGRCKQSGNSCSGTIGNAGQSRGSCCDPARGTQATLQCEKDNTCTGGSPYKWPDNQIPLKWWFNPNNMAGKEGYSSFSQQQILDILKKAFDSWSTPACTSFRHSYSGTSTNFLSAQDRQSTYMLPSSSQWAQMGAGASTLAFTRPVPDNSGTLIDADIAFNPRPGGRGWSSSLLQATAAHEMGHAIGFAHTGDPNALMYFAASGRTVGLTSDETSAVCFTYPKKGPCTKDADCGGCLQCSGGKCVDKQFTLARNLCKPCTKPDDCGGPKDICIRLEEGQRCAQACDAQGCCPKGYRCSDVGGGTQMCIPDSGKCPDVTCSADGDCGPGEECSSGKCRPKPIPLNPKTCKECTGDADCGSGSRCLRFDGKSRCLQNCVADNFCPNGYKCGATSAGRVCIPENTYCPCNRNTDCISGEVCRSGVCRPADCKYGCSCVEDAHCSPNHRCLQTQQGGGCFQPCGGDASYPKGEPGSECAPGGTCTGGASCYNVGGGRTICMKPCNSSSDCSATGGQCFRLGQQAFCLCQNDSQCGSSRGCNKTVLGQFGGGACAAKGSVAGCDKGLKCQSAGSISICQPDGTGTGDKGVGEACANPGACKQGLQCLQLEQGASTGYCFEECSNGGTCKFGGSCILGSQGSSRRFCGCQSSQAPCASGQTCKVVGPQGIGVCTGGTPPPDKCGNGTCDAGETCGSCVKDCACPTGKKCVSGACQDDAPPASCGNGRCEGNQNENCGNCAKDCACSAGNTCTNNSCVPVTDTCGNGQCEPAKGESCQSCAKDCACGGGWVCRNAKCVDPGSVTKDAGGSGPDGNNGLPCSPDEQFIGPDGKPACPEPTEGGCKCSAARSDGTIPASGLLMLAFFGLLLLARGRRL